MDFIVRGKHFHVEEHVAERARTKFSHLEHYLPLLRDATCEVDLAHEKAKEPDQRYVVHVTVSAHGVHLQAEERAGQPEAAIDQAAHVLGRQAQRRKDRLYDRGKPRRADDTESMPEEGEPVRDRVVKTKRFPVKPMTPAEAIEQIEALDHDFFVFQHAEADQIAVLYRRNDGDYGLIIPELP